MCDKVRRQAWLGHAASRPLDQLLWSMRLLAFRQEKRLVDLSLVSRPINAGPLGPSPSRRTPRTSPPHTSRRNSRNDLFDNLLQLDRSRAVVGLDRHALHDGKHMSGEPTYLIGGAKRRNRVRNFLAHRLPPGCGMAGEGGMRSVTREHTVRDHA